MIENLLIGSGGTLGFYFIGCLKVLEKKGLLSNIKNILGISVGSLIGLMICLDYTIDEIYEFSMKVDLLKILNIKENSFLDISSNYGFDNGKSFIRVIQIVIKHKTGNKNITFKEMKEKFKKNLIVVGTNITKSKSNFFNADTYPDMMVWEAIIISCSIPMVFQPYKFEDNLYLDGAVDQDYTIYFKEKYNTLNLIVEKIDNETRTIDTFLDFIKSIIFYNIRSKRAVNFDIRNTIDYKSYDDNNPIDFELPNEKKKEIYELGYNEANKRIDEILLNLQNFKKEYENKIKDIKDEEDKLLSVDTLKSENEILKKKIKELEELLKKNNIINDDKNKEINITDQNISND